MVVQESILLDSFAVNMADCADVAIEELHALSISVSWPHRPEDWQFLLKVGKGVVARDRIERTLGSAMWFPYGNDFASIGMVITSPRLQAKGAARWLMNYVMARTGERTLGLNATREALRLYVSLGFTISRSVYQCQGNALAPPAVPLPEGATLRDVMPGDLPELAELDEIAYGANRSKMLTCLLDVSKGVVLVRKGRVEAFSLCRRFGRGWVVGPVVAMTDADAVAVAYPHVAKHAGQYLRIDTRQASGAFRELIERSNLTLCDTLISMWRGRPWPVENDSPGDQPITYALASHTLG